MLLLRHHLRSLALVWLVCQMLSLTTLLGADCCPDHHLAASDDVQCAGHADGLCPMAAMGGAECPMHAPGGLATDRCVIRGLCDAPATALSTLIPLPGILPPLTGATALDTVSPLWLAPAMALSAAVSHDTPPPRL